MVRDSLDGVLIEVDEDGFHLILSGGQAEYDLRLPGTIAEELLRAVKREIEPWYLEGERVRTHYIDYREVENERYPEAH